MAQFRGGFRNEFDRLNSRMVGGRTAGNPGLTMQRVGPQVLKRRLEQAVVAALVNHPELLDAFAEDIGMINVNDPALDNLRQEILKLHACVEELDSDSLKNHLTQKGGKRYFDLYYRQRLVPRWIRAPRRRRKRLCAGLLNYCRGFSSQRGGHSWKRQGKIS